MNENLQICLDKVEFCWWCGGYGMRRCYKTEQYPTGMEPCTHCKGTGYGESYKTYCKRKGINIQKEPS